MIGLTKKQSDCLNAIKAHMDQFDISPSYREIRDSLHLKSTGNVHSLVNALKKRGWIDFTPGCSRSIILTSKAAEWAD